MIAQPRQLGLDLEEVLVHVDAKTGSMLPTTAEVGVACVNPVEGGVNAARSMDAWIARLEKTLKLNWLVAAAEASRQKPDNSMAKSLFEVSYDLSFVV